MFGKITDYTLEGQKLVIRFEEREGVIEAVTDGKRSRVKSERK